MLLRHSPEKANLTLNKDGWCDVEDLLENTDFTIEELKEIVHFDAKGRYAWNEKCTHIRANQGHSTSEVKMTFKKEVPPAILYHGTTAKAWKQIQKTGLLPMNRHHVHLTDNLRTAEQVGARRNGFTILEIDCIEMFADKIPFYRSENGVWLVDKVEPKYIEECKE